MGNIIKGIIFVGVIITFLFILCFILNWNEARKKSENQGFASKEQNGVSSTSVSKKFRKRYRNTIIMSMLLLVHLLLLFTYINKTLSCDTPAKATIIRTYTKQKSMGGSTPVIIYTVYHAKISYITKENETFKGTITTLVRYGWEVGSQIDIIYNSKSPSKYTTPQDFKIAMRTYSTPSGILRSFLLITTVYVFLLFISYCTDKKRWKRQQI